nr:hypothetical protein HK105_001253 [Polyrhizophydium stewartii]
MSNLSRRGTSRQATVIRAPVVDSQEFSHLVSGTSLVSSYSSPARGMTTRTAGSRRTSIAGDAASVYASNNNAMNFGASSGSDENTALRAPAKIADDLSINRSAAFFNHKQRLREKDKARPDASACVAVVGAPGSGKRGVIEIECGSVNEDAMVRTHHDDSLSIKITSKMYVAGNQNIRIEYWDAPEREDMLRFTARYVAGLTATLFVFDVNDDMSLDNLVPWIEEIGTHAYSQNSQSPFGLCKFLIGNKTNTPGKRAILEVDAKAFAHREFDDNERIHEIFQALVDNLQRTMPRELSPRPTVNKPTDQPKLTPYAPPIGMQIGIAMDPALKVMYRLRLRETQPNRNAATTVVDWLKVASTNNFTKYSKAIYG